MAAAMGVVLLIGKVCHYVSSAESGVTAKVGQGHTALLFGEHKMWGPLQCMT